jgi:hypothetical protein
VSARDLPSTRVRLGTDPSADRNAYQGNINDAKIRAAADALVSLGLKDAGYTYVNIDVRYGVALSA